MGPPGTPPDITNGQRAGSGQDGAAAADECRLAIDGQISGAVTEDDAPAPDGFPVGMIFSGGPGVSTNTSGGRYSLPLLAVDCTNARNWIPFRLFAPGYNQIVLPQSDQVTQDVTIPPGANMPALNQPPCQLVLGTISGTVTVGGSPAPDGTAVIAATGPSTNRNQAVTTHGGVHELSSVGVTVTDDRCGSDTAHFLSTTLSVLGCTLTFTPATNAATQDIDVPSGGCP